tara:strand:+ start:803 stop:1213 length:411 start_codon:yes stop_codon:yes gene_type:complete
MNLTISLNQNLIKNIEHISEENLIYDIANNTNCYNIYNDYELDGINNYIKNNNKIYIIEYDNIDYFINFLSFVKSIIKDNKNLYIEYIYNNNDILYASQKYLNNRKETNVTKNDLLNNIEINKNNKIYNKIYNHFT